MFSAPTVTGNTMLNLEWENANSLRNYPLREGVNRRSVNGLEIPQDALVDLAGFVPAGEDQSFYISSVVVTQDLRVTFNISGVQTDDAVGQFILPPTFSPAESFDFFGPGLGTTGKAVIGEGMVTVQRWGVGTFRFFPSETELEANTLVPLDTGVVTSVGILGNSRVLVGDVKLLYGRAIEGETDLLNNSLVISAIKRVEDCASDQQSCAIQAINGLRPDSRGNIQLTAEGIMVLQPGTSGSSEGGEGAPGLTLKTILKQDQLCVRPFEEGLRGADGATGAGGPSGGGGGFVKCCPSICCECQECDTCEQWNAPIGGWGVPRAIGSAPGPMGGGGGSGGGGISLEKPLVNEGDILTIGGDGFQQPSTGAPGAVTVIDCVIFCKSDGTYIAVPPGTVYGPQLLDVQVPAGLTDPPSPDNVYCVRLKTPWGYTNSILICVNPAPTNKIESFDVIGGWLDVRGPFTFITGTAVEGAGAFNVQSILPFGTNINNTSLSGIGGPPWDFSSYTGLQIQVAKEYDPAEGAPADSIEIQLTDSGFSTLTLQAPIPGSARFTAPHVINVSDYVAVPLLFASGSGAANLTDIILVSVSVTDFATAIPVQAWWDCLEGIP